MVTKTVPTQVGKIGLHVSARRGASAGVGESVTARHFRFLGALVALVTLATGTLPARADLPTFEALAGPAIAQTQVKPDRQTAAQGQEEASSSPVEARALDTQAAKSSARPIEFDADGYSNELIVRFRYDRPAQERLLSEDAVAAIRSQDDYERALVAAIVNGAEKARAELPGAESARMLTAGSRLGKDHRAAYGTEHPRARLEEYVVLSYADVAAAKQAFAALRLHPSVISVEHNQRVVLSWVPNDPYFSRKTSGVIGPAPAPGAGTYQWGMQAMQFPGAWDVTKGHANVGTVDAGLVDGVALSDLEQNYRPQYSHAVHGWGVDRVRGWTFHGAHVLGIIGASADGKGVVGGCPSCSLATARPMDQRDVSADTDFSAAVEWLIQTGMQVVNISMNRVPGEGSDAEITTTCQPGEVASVLTSSLCAESPHSLGAAMALLKRRDIVTVASSGNYREDKPTWPASLPWVLAVAGAQNLDPASPQAWELWLPPWMDHFNPPDSDHGHFYATNPDGHVHWYGSSKAGTNGVVAPAQSIVSTVLQDQEHIGWPPFRCTDKATYSDQAGTLPGDESGVPGDGYASCTGTSMAAPHVSALAGLLRSIDPLKSEAEIRQIIRASGSNAQSPNAEIGWGMPNAAAAVAAMLPGPVKNKLTPLFSFYSGNRLDFFYTTVPQMATAAIEGTLQPHKNFASYPADMYDYVPQGASVAATYSAFPGAEYVVFPAPDLTPRAEVWVFTTENNPLDSATPLVPLYRLSWKCGDRTPAVVSVPDAQPAICASVPKHIDTTYTTEQAGIDGFKSVGYQLDGIEGYIYPKTVPQPVGTVRLMRKYNPVRDDHAIFPESQLAAMTALGYTQNSYSDWLGYVYPNTNGLAPAIGAADVTPPTVPSGLGATVLNGNQVNLLWSASTDNVGVTGYKIYRNGTLVGTVAGTNYQDSGLAAGTYSYAVAACDAAGNCSAQSTPVSISVSAGTASVNVALAANGGVASASSIYSTSYYYVGAVIDGDRKGIGGKGWASANTGFPQWFQVNFSGAKTIGEIDVFTLQDNYTSPVEPTSTMAFASYGLSGFQVQTWDGANWVTVTGGNVTGNNLIWRKFTFAPVTTDRIRILCQSSPGGYSRLVEVEAWTAATQTTNAPPTVSLTSPANGASYTAPASVALTANASDSDGSVAKVDFYRGSTLVGTATSAPYSFTDTNVAAGSYSYTAVATDNVGAATTSTPVSISVSAGAPSMNVALAANGGVASASSMYWAPYYYEGAVIDGDRKGVGGNSWASGNASYPQTFQVNFSGPKTIGEIDVFMMQDNLKSPIDPTPSMTFTLYGLSSFQVQTWDGANWVTVSGGNVTGNTLVWRKFTFAPVTTDRIRIVCLASPGGYSRLVEVEAWTTAGSN